MPEREELVSLLAELINMEFGCCGSDRLWTGLPDDLLSRIKMFVSPEMILPPNPKN